MIIEITSPPEGSSPDWVRRAWVGMKIRTVQDEVTTVPTVSAVQGEGRGLTSLLVRLQRKTVLRTGYLVNAKDALGLLSLQNEEAACWCIEHTPQMLNPEQVFLFEESCCRAIPVQ